MDTEFDFPCNQEQLRRSITPCISESDEEDLFDYKLDLTNVNSSPSCPNAQDTELSNVVASAVENFNNEMNKRHKIACAREGLSYAITGGKHPPFLKWQMDCHPNLGDSSLNKEFQEMWKSKASNIKDKAMKSAIDFLDTKIEAGNSNLREIRMEALNKIGKKNPASGLARTKLNQIMTKSKEEFDRRLLQFKMDIRAERRRPDTGPIRSQNWKAQSKNHGKKNHRPY